MNDIDLPPFDPAAITEWLHPFRNGAANGLLPAAADGLFRKYLGGDRLLDVMLDSESRPALAPFAFVTRISATDMRFPGVESMEATFDAILVSDVLQKLENPIGLIGALHRRLDVGGHLVLAVPHRDLFEKRYSPPSRTRPDHKRFYTMDRLLLDVRAACGVNAMRVRFASEYDEGHDYDPAPDAAPAGGYSFVVVFEKTGRRDVFPDLKPVDLERSSQRAELDEEALIESSPAELLRASLPLDAVKTICVLKLDHIGDFAMMATNFVELRASFPQSRLTLVCGPWNLGFAESLRLFDEVLPFDFYKQDERHGGPTPEDRTSAPERLRACLDGRRFDLAIDFRVPSDSRDLLLAVEAKARAGIGTPGRFPFLDIASPTQEYVLQDAEVLRPQSQISLIPRRFKYHCPTAIEPGVAICHPETTDYFISGPYVALSPGVYSGSLRLRTYGEAIGRPIRISFDVAAFGGQVLYVSEREIDSDTQGFDFEFDAVDDLLGVEVRVRLIETPSSRIPLFFLGVEFDSRSPLPCRRLLPPAALHISEHVTLLLALVRSRLTRATDMDALRARLGADAPPSDIPHFVMAPVSNSALRDWPVEQYVALGERLLKRTSARIVLLGSASQEAALADIAARMEPEGAGRVLWRAGAPWAETLPLIASAAMTVTNNSGLAHVAALLGARAVSVYSGSHQAAEWGPIGDRSRTLQAHLPCSPCGFDSLNECAHGHRCLRGINPGDVLALIERQVPYLFASGADEAG